ncbi:SDR family oxidoreductase [Thermosynechococcaceae cyanobacterium BACA0444]|uniref:SDR family oxidoreductase n=1 Tax=Pseudocalidococcus azoricus BACA0444 TaxID=2918990 RepID=A0AAE4JWA9_9CYAN|nr:SDR family oxidoreductase [Pseudocalidococcus azoricus]MDS3861165.1 SDR family oxidoreductase [Pseudocalidococcus azoricus BACA0444]
MPVALITGASRGIGAAFAQALAAKQYDLILSARNQAQLQAVGDPLQQQYGITVKYIVQDLSQSEAAQGIFQQVQAWGMTVDLLINNAGFGDYGEFASRDLGKFTAMIQVNITALVELTHLFLGEMQQRQQGEVLNVSSIAGFLPMPYISVYAATKAFVLHFSEALWAENYGRGITVMAVCPGPTRTEFFDVAEMTQAPGMSKGDAPEGVVKEALMALAARRSHLVSGQLQNRVVVSLPRFLPRDVLVKTLEPRFRPPA